VGCSCDWPARKCAADLVRMTRMERFGVSEKADMMSGSLIVATLPDDAISTVSLLVQET
jgi:hypothetical protein